MTQQETNNSRYETGRPDTKKIESILQSASLESYSEALDEVLDEVGFRHIRSMMLRLYVVMEIYIAARGFSRDFGISDDKFVSLFGTADEIETTLSSVDDSIAFLKKLISQCIIWRIEGVRDNNKYTVKNAKEYINNNYMNCDMSLGSVAEAVGISPAYLSALFKKETGQNMSEYITLSRIQRSKELLCCTSKFIYEIAYEVGFRDYRYFSQIFKKHTGQTPREFQTSANVGP